MPTQKSFAPGNLKAVILVGGFGTRLRPLTDNCPKPIVPVLNRPFLEHTLAHLKSHGISEVVLAMSYLPDAIRAYFGDGERCGMKLHYCMEEEPLGTAGAVKNAAAHLDDTFLVLNGDNVFIDMDIGDMLAFHRENKSKATIALTWVENPSAFGVVETDERRKVRRFIEKPPPGTATTNWINAGGYILEPDTLDHIPSGQPYMFEKGLFPHLLEIGAPLYGYTYRGYWLDMGTPSKYFNFNVDLLSGRTKSLLLPDNRNDATYYGKDTQIHRTAQIKGPLLTGAGCTIGKDACITGPGVMGDRCVIGDGARVENTILWDNVAVGENARLSHCIIGSGVIIPAGSEIRDCVMTADKTVPLSA